VLLITDTELHISEHSVSEIPVKWASLRIDNVCKLRGEKTARQEPIMHDFLCFSGIKVVKHKYVNVLSTELNYKQFTKCSYLNRPVCLPQTG
jgi:hypothetical protein